MANRAVPKGSEHGIETCREQLASVPLTKIVTNDLFKLRRDFISIDALAEDLKRRGQLCPLFVRPLAGNAGFELISGHRRLAALRKNKVKEAVVRIFPKISNDDALRLAVAENVQREDLTHLEKALLCLKLQDQNKSRIEIAKLVFPSVASKEADRTVANYLTVARTDPKIQTALAHGNICFSVAILLADSLKSKTASALLASDTLDSTLSKISREDMSVREVKALLENPKSTNDEEPSKRNRSASSPCSWQEGKRGGWTFRLNFNPSRIGSNPEKLKQIEAEVLKVLEKVREHL